MRTFAIATLAGAWVLALATAVPAAGTVSRAVTVPRAVTVSRAATATNTLDAGYLAAYRTPPATMSASGKLTVPGPACTSADSGVAFWVATETDAPQDNFTTAHRPA